MKEELRKKLNIQFFAEPDNATGGTDGGNGNQPKTYSEEEYNKLKNDYDKLKTQFDKTSSDVAELKKQAKAKLSEEEQKAQENAEKEKQFADMQSQIEDYQLKDELLKGNIFTNEDIEKIILSKNDKKELLKSIVSLVQAKIVEERKNAIEEFMRSSDVNASSNNNGNIDSTVQAYIDSQKNKISSNARKHFLNK